MSFETLALLTADAVPEDAACLLYTSQNGLTPGEDVTIEYMSEATEVLAAMQASSGYPVAMLPLSLIHI